MHLGDTFDLLKTAFREWNEDQVPRLAAALSYYTLFAITHLIIIVIAIAALAFGEEAASGRIFNEVRGTLGDQAAIMLQDMVVNASQPRIGLAASGLAVIMLLLGATGVLGELKGALNIIWDVEKRPGGGVIDMVKERF